MNTIFPLFKPFMKETRAKTVIDKIRNNNANRIVRLMGLDTANIFTNWNNSIKICPMCFEEDISEDCEAYLRRNHQIPGNFICEKHSVMLEEYNISSNINSVFFDINSLSNNQFEVKRLDNHLKKNFMELSEDISFVLNGGLDSYDINSIMEKYRKALQGKGYLFFGRINQEQLELDFLNYYPKEFLFKMESFFDENDKMNWINLIFSNTSVFVYPLRHLLLMRFLFGSVKLFSEYKDDYRPFGSGPWVCLNPVCEKYMHLAISECKMKPDYTRRNPVGEFECTCGFIYSRKGPDEKDDDNYRYDKIIQYGMMWENKLMSLIKEGNISINQLTKIFKCHRDVIIRHATVFGIADRLNTKLRLGISKVSSISESRKNCKVGVNLSVEEYNSYKNSIVKFIIDNKNANREQIKRMLCKQYSTIYRKDKEWLESVLPKPTKPKACVRQPFPTTFWNKRDDEVLQKVKDCVEEIMKFEKPIRITRMFISKRICYYNINDKNTLEKLPKTKEFLQRHCETFEQFRVRLKTVYEQS